MINNNIDCLRSEFDLEFGTLSMRATDLRTPDASKSDRRRPHIQSRSRLQRIPTGFAGHAARIAFGVYVRTHHDRLESSLITNTSIHLLV